MFTLFLIVANISFSWQLKLVKQIPVDEGSLLQSASFVVLEDGKLLFTDIRDKNSQLKIFNEDGKLIKAWGKMGPGPEEFGGLGFPDYKSPYLAVSDAGKRRIYIFKKLNNDEFKRIGDILAWEQSGNIKIYDKSVLIWGFIVSPQGKKYGLFMRDFNEKETRYILPIEYSYGARSMSEHKKVVDEVSGISAIAFFDVYDDTVFYVSDVRLKIIKVNLKFNQIEIFGQEGENFRPVKMNKITKETLIKTRSGLEDIMTKHSFVSGIFADREFVGVIYVHREKKIGDTLYYVPYVQIYDHSGKLLREQRLTSFYSEERIVPLYYQKDSRYLYLCSIIYGTEFTKYLIHKYQLEP